MTELTDFQRRILEFLPKCVNQETDPWVIAQAVFPEKWAHRAGRGALIGHITRAAVKMGRDCWIVVRPAEHQYDLPRISLTPEAWRKPR